MGMILRLALGFIGPDVVVLGEVVQELLPHERVVQEPRQLIGYVLDGLVCKRPRHCVSRSQGFKIGLRGLYVPDAAEAERCEGLTSPVKTSAFHPSQSTDDADHHHHPA
jgi:hypothetical protein